MGMRLEKLCCGPRLRKPPLLGPFDLELGPGQLVALMGPNGCGKTTLLKTMMGALHPHAGRVCIADQDLKELSFKQRALLVSSVFTKRAWPEYATVAEVVAMGRIPHQSFFNPQRGAKFHQPHVERALALVGLRALATRRLSQLSDGQRQKALIALALCQDTPLMLLDEPTTFLDWGAKGELMLLLQRLCQEEKKLIIFSSHDWDFIQDKVPQVLLLDRSGHLISSSPVELVRSGALTRAFV
jgi:iron complex transport system ATP-binding protein